MYRLVATVLCVLYTLKQEFYSLQLLLFCGICYSMQPADDKQHNAFRATAFNALPLWCHN